MALKRLLGIGTCLVLGACSIDAERADVQTTTEGLSTGRQLADFWAPALYQDTGPASLRSEYITNFDYDGDYVGKNNWEHRDAYSLPGYVYYSVSETRSHWFVGYYFFHPRDDDSNSHENDLEGILLAVRRDGSQYGALEHMLTEAHGHFYFYTNAGASNGTKDIQGAILCELGTCNAYGHPQIFIENGGHGVFACGDPDNSNVDCDTAPGSTGLVYAYKGVAEIPGSGGLPDGSGNWQRTNPVGYDLIAIESPGVGTACEVGDNRCRRQGFWYLQNHICDTCAFASYGTVRGDNGGDNKANMPWEWDDDNDGETFVGDWLCDPANLFDVDLNHLGTFSHVYTDHRYWTHKFETAFVYMKSDMDSDPYAADTYYKVTAPGVIGSSSPDVIDARVWKDNDVALNTWSHQLVYGGDDAEGQREYGERVGTHYFCRQTKAYTVGSYGQAIDYFNAGSNVTVSTYDSDDGADSLIVSAVASASSKNGSCNLDDDTYSPNGQPHDTLPLITMYDYTCGLAGVNSNTRGQLWFKLSRVKRPDVSNSGSCNSQTGSTCGGPSASGDCYCDAFCRGYGDCCADKISVCGAGWLM